MTETSEKVVSSAMARFKIYNFAYMLKLRCVLSEAIYMDRGRGGCAQ